MQSGSPVILVCGNRKHVKAPLEILDNLHRDELPEIDTRE